MYCEKCGTRNDDNATTCIQCGSGLQPGATTPLNPPPQIPVAQAYSPNRASQPQVPNHLVPAILVTLFCCLPFGIVSIIYSAQVNTKLAQGNIQGAVDDSKKAKTWAIVALVLGIVPAILMLAAIGIPNLLRARIAANEASAVGSIRMIETAESTYSTLYTDVGFTCNLQDLSGPPSCSNGTKEHACLIDNTLATGQKSGYSFSIRGCSRRGMATHFEVYAEPLQRDASGAKSFCSDETGVIKSTHPGTEGRCLQFGTPIN